MKLLLSVFLSLATVFAQQPSTPRVDSLQGLWQGFDGEWGHVSQQLIALAETLPADKYPYMHEITRHVIDGSHDGTHDFSFGLELILDGLDRLRAR